MSRRLTARQIEALQLLASLSDAQADFLGFHRLADGTLGDPCSREDWRIGLLSGRTDPDSFIRTVQLVQWAASGRAWPGEAS